MDSTQFISAYEKNKDKFKNAYLDPKDLKLTIRIEGHTDSDGAAKSNMKLSLLRAETVKDYFLNNYDFNTTFLSFYLNDINIKTAWIQDISQSSKTNIIGFSKNNIFPIKANNQRLKPIVMNKEKKRFALRYHSKKNVPSIILAVNESQKKFAEEYFFEKNIPFAIIKY